MIQSLLGIAVTSGSVMDKKAEKELLTDAATLADFANLEESGFDSFRNNYPDFFPPHFWDKWQSMTVDSAARATSPSKSGSFAKAIQDQIRSLWRDGFPLTQALGLLGAGGWVSMGESTPQTQEAYRQLGVDYNFRAWPFQSAAMFLFTRPWLASFCPNCGNRFVKSKKGQRFCGQKCFTESRKAYKRNQWAQHKKEWRTSRTRTAGRLRPPKSAK